MKLTNKVTNAFFGIIAVISLFMPIVGYRTLLSADEFSIADLFGFLKDFDPNADATLLSNLGNYGYKEEAICVMVFFAVMLLCLLAVLVLSFVNVPYLVRMIVSGLGLASYITAVEFFFTICNGFMKGAIPTTAITSLGSGGESSSIITNLIASFTSVDKMGITTGAFVGMTCFAVLFLVNLVFFIFRKKIALADGEKPKQKSKKQKKSKK